MATAIILLATTRVHAYIHPTTHPPPLGQTERPVLDIRINKKPFISESPGERKTKKSPRFCALIKPCMLLGQRAGVYLKLCCTNWISKGPFILNFMAYFLKTKIITYLQSGLLGAILNIVTGICFFDTYTLAKNVDQSGIGGRGGGSHQRGQQRQLRGLIPNQYQQN